MQGADTGSENVLNLRLTTPQALFAVVSAELIFAVGMWSGVDPFNALAVATVSIWATCVGVGLVVDHGETHGGL